MPVIYSNSSNNFIPEVTSDPVSPIQQTAWVLHTTVPSVTGTPLGLLLSLTHSSLTTEVYQLSYYTLENTIVRTGLS